MTSGPALTPLLRLPQAIEGVMKIVEMDARKSINPMSGVREAEKNRHKASFSEEQFLGVLSAGDVTSRLLDPTNEAFQIMIGTRHQWLLQVIKEMGRPCEGDLLNVGNQAQQSVVRTAVLKVVHNRQ
jgi:hypothetical protein